MGHSLKINGNHARVSLTDKIYAQEAGIVRNLIIDQIERGVTEIVFDLAEVSYIDSAGLGVLVTIHKRTQEKNGRLVLTGVRGMVREILKRTVLDQVLTIE